MAYLTFSYGCRRRGTDESQKSTFKIAPLILQRCCLACASSYDRRSVAEVVQSSQIAWLLYTVLETKLEKVSEWITCKNMRCYTLTLLRIGELNPGLPGSSIQRFVLWKRIVLATRPIRIKNLWLILIYVSLYNSMSSALSAVRSSHRLAYNAIPAKWYYSEYPEKTIAREV
jgi:hypothetical protein